MAIGGHSPRSAARLASILLILVVAALAAAADVTPRPLAEPAVEGADWSADARSLRTRSGSRFVYVCPANGRLDQVWGTRIYTDDSSVCTAAVHGGLITVADGGIVTIEHLAGQASYTGSTQNGVTSASYGAWDGSFQLIGASKGSDVTGVKMGGGAWNATASSFRGQNGVRFRYICPAGGNVGTVWGTNVYTDDSSVCTAAVHVGLITRADGGRVTIEIRPGQRSYVGFAHNGVTTRDYGSWTGSFVFAGAPPIPGSPGGGGGGSTTTTTTGSGGTIPPPVATPSGTVLVNGRPFTGTAEIAFNSTVDVTNGSLRLRSGRSSLTVNGQSKVPAAFKLVRARDGKRQIVELRLTKGNFSACPKRKTSSASGGTAAKPVRQIWGNGKGSFRTRGKYAAATVRGTRWLTSDRCDGTQVRVVRGTVQVRDFPHRRLVTVKAGSSYLAKP